MASGEWPFYFDEPVYRFEKSDARYLEPGDVMKSSFGQYVLVTTVIDHATNKEHDGYRPRTEVMGILFDGRQKLPFSVVYQRSSVIEVVR